MGNRTSRFSIIAAACIFCLAATGLWAQAAGSPAAPPLPQLQAALRDLWVGHIFWVRNVVFMTKLGNTAAAKVAEGRVVQDAKDIANALQPYYGQAAADKLFSLLAAHYGAVKDYMVAAFAEKKAAMKSATDKLYANADEIAAFLSAANPNWPKDALVAALRAHGAQHIQQIDAVNAKDYAREAEVWGMMKDHIYAIADVLAQGLEKQFGSSEGSTASK